MRTFGPETIDRLRAVLRDRPSAPYDDPARRRAAVLIPLFLDGPDVRVVLIKRSDSLRSHPGEVSFPGGRIDPGDTSPLEAALREAAEETGIRAEDVTILGRLDDMPTASSGFVIAPFVGRIPSAAGLVPDGVEAERILTPALALFADPARQNQETRTRDGVPFVVNYVDVGGDVVWGATARMLLTLLAVLDGREAPPPNVIPIPRV